MLKIMTRRPVIQAWFAVVLISTAISAILGAIPTLGTLGMLIMLALVPAGTGVVLVLLPARPPTTSPAS